MATFDLEQQKIVSRIVYDGAARAGKTTNVKRLCELFTGVRRSELYTPDEREGKTLWFDWVQLEGGLVCGYPLSCQIITVPGQRALLRRRSFLLASADVVVFVADSGRGAASRTRAGFEVLRDALDARGAERPPFVIQANKQDKRDALDPEALSRVLRLPASAPVIPARAHEGVGVRETIVRAVKVLTDHLQALSDEHGLSVAVDRAQSADELLSAMTDEELFDDLSAAALDDEDDDEPIAEPSVPARTIAIPAPAPPPPAVRVPPFPRSDARTGYVWPALIAREVLRELELAESTAGASARSSLLVEGDEHRIVCRVGGFVVKTSAARRYADPDEARADLVRIARGKSLIGQLHLPGTVLALQRDDAGGYRLWTVHRAAPTLAQMIDEAASTGDEATLAALFALHAQVVAQAVVLASREHLVVDLAPASYVVVDGRAYFAGDEIAFGSDLANAAPAAVLPLDFASAFPNAASGYLDRLEGAMRGAWTAADVERTGFGRALADLDGLQGVAVAERVRRAVARSSRALKAASGAER